MAQPDKTTIRCIACKKDIVLGASVCPTCSSYQKRWKNTITFWGPFFAGVLALFGVTTYLFQNVPAVWNQFFGKDSVSLLAYNGRDRLLLRNAGASEVFVLYLAFSSSKLGNSKRIAINKLIRPKEFLAYEFERNKNRDDWAYTNYLDKAWDWFLTKGPMQNECFEWRYMSIEDPFYLNIKNFVGKNFKELPAEGELIFDSIRSGERRKQSVDVSILPFVNPNPTQACIGQFQNGRAELLTPEAAEKMQGGK